ncbi:MAG: thiol-disulfide oxidoreductase DCC family protein [Ferruginibacter sp.]
MAGEPIILFDGICNLCNTAVTFVIKRDKRSRIKFATLQSDTGRQLLEQYHLPTGIFNSFVLIEQGVAYRGSTAALKVSKYLAALWPAMYGFIIVPAIVRDGLYQWIAKNRYKWFGKQEQCMVPTPEITNRFLK